jgi:beta-lactamase class D
MTTMIRGLLAFVLVGALSGKALAGEGVVEKPEWAMHFSKAGVNGTMVVVDERQVQPKTLVFNRKRSVQRFAPASTFKIPHTLFALDAGAVADEFQVFPWDGVKRTFEGHNQDQNLRSAMRNSTLWVYQGFARHIGEAQARSYLQKSSYGNADPTGAYGDYWVDGNLRISAMEQVAFLQKLYRNILPFKVEHQRLVKDLMVKQATSNWILRAKTGWEGSYGWWMGWVETPEGAVFFALNMDTPRRLEDLPKREQIVRKVLGSMGLLVPD